MVGRGGREGAQEGGLRETASRPHRHLDSAAMFFCSLIKQPRGRKRRRLPPRKGGSTVAKEEEENRPERGGRDGREGSCLEVE